MGLRSIRLDVAELGVTLNLQLLKRDKARGLQFGFQDGYAWIARQLNLNGIRKVSCMGLTQAEHFC